MKQAKLNCCATIKDLIDTNKTELQKAYEVQMACATIGFDWPNITPVFHKVNEEFEELKDEVYGTEQDQEKIEEELGDLLFSVVNLSRHLNIRPDIALAKANDKFVKRFDLVASYAEQEGVLLDELNIDSLEKLWQRAKLEKGK